MFVFEFQNFWTEPMPINDTCIYFIIALLGLAYPIALTVVTRLDDKYKSGIILNLFERSRAFRAFRQLLMAAIICVAVQVLWIINFKPLPAAHLQYRFHDWSEVTMAVITALLLLSFFWFTYTVFQFYIPANLVKMLRKRPDDEEHLGFKSLAALLFVGIEISDDRLVKTITQHFAQLFRQIRTDAGNAGVKYPVEYYEFVYDAIFRSAKSDYWKVQHVGYSAASGTWLIGSHEYNHIDELTYAWLWNNLKLMLELNKENYLEEFWQNSHQLISYGLGPIRIQHEAGNFEHILNQEEVDQRQAERARFFEFHTALGGMLLYCKRYGLLNRLFNHTTSIPVRYELLPVTMNEVLALFFRFWTSDGMFYIGKYQFPNSGGIQGEFVSREFIGRYTALLFLRQYLLVSQWYGYEPVSLPFGPSTQDERSYWLQNLPYFKKFVDEIQENEDLLRALHYEKITPEWSEAHHKPGPAQLIEQLIEQIKAAYSHAEIEQQAEDAKKQTFFTSSAAIIDGRIDSYADVINPAPESSGYVSTQIRGGYILYKKAAFALEQDTTYLNYDSFFASEIANGITREITASFKSKTQRTYLFRGPQLFEAIDKMHLRADEHVLVNFGISIPWILQRHRTEYLTESNYKGIPIITLEFKDTTVMRDCFIVMRRADLPWFVFSPPEQSEINRFELAPIGEGHQLFASVLDMNEHAGLRSLFPNDSPATLNTSVLLSLVLDMEVRFKQNVKMIRLSLYSDFYQEGTPNEVSEVTRF